jgi:hypothetical protein
MAYCQVKALLKHHSPAPFPRISLAPVQAKVVGVSSIGGDCFVKTGLLLNVDTRVE